MGVERQAKLVALAGAAPQALSSHLKLTWESHKNVKGEKIEHALIVIGVMGVWRYNCHSHFQAKLPHLLAYTEAKPYCQRKLASFS